MTSVISATSTQAPPSTLHREEPNQRKWNPATEFPNSESQWPVNEMHKNALTLHPEYQEDKVERFPLENASWETVDAMGPEYKPTQHTSEKVINNQHNEATGKGWADPCDITETLKSKIVQRFSYFGAISFVNDYPRNPVGATGMTGQGTLGNWGPNHAADPMITRLNPETGKKEFFLTLRSDGGGWAIPGGMVERSDMVDGLVTTASIQKTFGKEFIEESGGGTTDLLKQKKAMAFLSLLATYFGTTVYKGYADDSRNTDNAWIETCATKVHLTDGEAKKAGWFTIDQINQMDANKTDGGLFAGHERYLKTAAVKDIRTPNTDQIAILKSMAEGSLSKEVGEKCLEALSSKTPKKTNSTTFASRAFQVVKKGVIAAVAVGAIYTVGRYFFLNGFKAFRR